MGINITIRNLPPYVKDELARRAKLEGLTLQEYLHIELEDVLLRPPRSDWLSRGQESRRAWEPRTTSEKIVEMIRQDRGW